MKKLLAILLVFAILLSGCSSAAAPAAPSPYHEVTSDPEPSPVTENTDVVDAVDLHALEDDPGVIVEGNSKSAQPEVSFSEVNDPGLLDYVEQNVFAELSEQLGPEYRVENVSATYVSKEYLEEVAYNSQANVFFGYSLADLDAQFQGTRYVFTLDEHNETAVVPFEKYDDTYDQVLKNVAIGTGVILICVTVSAISGGAGAPAVSMIFAASAKT